MLRTISEQEYRDVEKHCLPYNIVKPVIPDETPRPYIEYNDQKLYENSIVKGIFYYSHKDKREEIPYTLFSTGEETSYKDYFEFKGRIISISDPCKVRLDCSAEFESLKFDVSSLHLYITDVIKVEPERRY